MSLSRLSVRCRQCPFVDCCNNKEMEALGCLAMPVAASISEPASANMAAPILRETRTIMVDGKSLTVYVDDIEKQLYGHLYSGLHIQPGC